MKIFKVLLAAFLISGLSAICSAEIAVIVNPSSGISSLSKQDIARIYLGKTKSFPNGNKVVPVQQYEGSSTRDAFNDQVCNKSASQFKAYWSKLVFTGKGKPPEDVGSDSDVVKAVAIDPNKIGYVDAASVDSTVHVVYRF
ncbi:hypothetical protein TDB9533_00978 [Thalassocella blandensis]|nr:hypothetical protein TDB9533_00978 [Thalassocella blandensis]